MVIKSDQQKLKTVRQHHLPPALQPKPKPVKQTQPAEPTVSELDLTKGALQDALHRIGELEQELAAERQARYDEGFKAGRTAGYKKGVDEVKAHIDKFTELTQAFQEKENEFLKNAEPFVVQLCLRITEKLVGSEPFSILPLDKKRLTQLTGQMLQQFSEVKRFVFRVHESGAKVIEDNRAALEAQFSPGITFSTLEDPTLKPADCMLESDFGMIDARIETQLQQIKTVLSLPVEEVDD